MTHGPRILSSNGLPRARRLAPAAAAVAAAAAIAVASHDSAAGRQHAAPGHAEVIAQGIVDLDEGPYSWTTAALSVGRDGPPIEATAATFLLGAHDSPVFVAASTGDRVLLDPGEAVFVAPGTTARLGELDHPGPSATLTRLTLSPTPEPGGAAALEPGAGRYDIDLWRDVLDPREGFALPASAVPVAVLLASGTADVTSPGGALHAITADVVLLAEPGSAIANTGDDPAVILAAIVSDAGTPADHAAASSTPTAGPGTSTATPPTTAPTTSTSAPPTTPTTTTSSTTTSTTAPTPPDNDGDNLTDDREAALGTNPHDPFSDDDGLNDGDEVDTYGTNPLRSDTDDDGVSDSNEADSCSSPTNPDSDGDGLSDGYEDSHGLNRCTTDSDGDGLADGDEINRHTNPGDYDTDDDGNGDGHDPNPLDPDVHT
jgi:Bacterial TSP3 repeat